MPVSGAIMLGLIALAGRPDIMLASDSALAGEPSQTRVLTRIHLD